MGTLEDPFNSLAAEAVIDEFAMLEQREVAPPPMGLLVGGLAAVGRLHGFDLLDQPLVDDVPQCPGQVLVARSTIPIRRSMVGADVVVLFDGGDLQRPIIMGVIQKQAVTDAAPMTPERGVTIKADNECHVVNAEREIVLRCGDASITLTRAGKVIIKGNYILSRSTGYNKIKGAAIDIN